MLTLSVNTGINMEAIHIYASLIWKNVEEYKMVVFSSQYNGKKGENIKNQIVFVSMFSVKWLPFLKRRTMSIQILQNKVKICILIATADDVCYYFV